ncbi:TPA: hypothetical protein ACH3X2_006004 [Trebouxia sp. C0005]
MLDLGSQVHVMLVGLADLYTVRLQLYADNKKLKPTVSTSRSLQPCCFCTRLEPPSATGGAALTRSFISCEGTGKQQDPVSMFLGGYCTAAFSAQIVATPQQAVIVLRGASLRYILGLVVASAW